jgi:hypothetical protein
MTRSPRPRRTASLSDLLHRQLNMYALAASAAGVGALALTQSAEAKIVYTPAHAHLPLALDLNHDGKVDFYLHSYGHSSEFALSACQYLASGSEGPFCSTSRGANRIRTSSNGIRRFGAALRYGAKIQGGDRFRLPGVRLGTVFIDPPSSISWLGPWFNGGKGVKNRYLGLKFEIKGRYHFGWARMTVMVTQNGFSATLTGYAYETIPGKAIIAGATKGPDDTEPTASVKVPTPALATLGMLALGAPGLSIWRRKDELVAAPKGS